MVTLVNLVTWQGEEGDSCFWAGCYGGLIHARDIETKASAFIVWRSTVLFEQQDLQHLQEVAEWEVHGQKRGL